MEAVLDSFLASPEEYAAEIELLRFWSFLSLGTRLVNRSNSLLFVAHVYNLLVSRYLEHYLPLWILSPAASLNVKPSRSSINPKFKILDPSSS
jgi:hypothetical protein